MVSKSIAFASTDVRPVHVAVNLRIARRKSLGFTGFSTVWTFTASPWMLR